MTLKRSLRRVFVMKRLCCRKWSPFMRCQLFSPRSGLLQGKDFSMHLQLKPPVKVYYNWFRIFPILVVKVSGLYSCCDCCCKLHICLFWLSKLCGKPGLPVRGHCVNKFEEPLAWRTSLLCKTFALVTARRDISLKFRSKNNRVHGVRKRTFWPKKSIS